MVDKNRITPLFPLVKGKTSKQAHANLPMIDNKVTYEHEHGRQGFFGKASHLYHKNPPTNYKHIDGSFKPEMFDTNQLVPTDKMDPWGSPTTFLRNNDVQLKISKRTEPMPFYYKNTEGDDIWFVHKGMGKIETIYGPLSFQNGDYIVIPRGTIYRVVPTTTDNHFLVIESTEEVNIPDRGLLGPHALFDPAIIVTPEPEVVEDNREWIVRYKRLGNYTHYTYPNNPLDVVGWKGDVTPWKISIKDFRPVNSHRYHLPPSTHTTFMSQGFIVCSFVPRPYETSEDAIKIPFFHSNVEYDEVIYYFEGDFMSRDDVNPGFVSFHPMGFTHGPHPKALKRMLKQDKLMTQEYAVMIDTRYPLEIPDEAKNALLADYWKSWQK
ncbi:MAG: homogentisate 1,2-dioxygenase [Candidatus Kariarchaeaceae archaeon]|jgi:homogentisate 1,2-dioxygenase